LSPAVGAISRRSHSCGKPSPKPPMVGMEEGCVALLAMVVATGDKAQLPRCQRWERHIASCLLAMLGWTRALPPHHQRWHWETWRSVCVRGRLMSGTK
jgi:hypothetical protein